MRKNMRKAIVLAMAGILSSGMPLSAYAATKLEPPTDVDWRDDLDGGFTWRRVDGASGKYFFEVYRDGEVDWSTNWNMGAVDVGEIYENSGIHDRVEDSGTYKFRVYAMGDGISTEDSDWSEFSSDWEFEMPDVQFGAPENLRWEGTVAKWDAPSDTLTEEYEDYGGGYQVALCENGRETHTVAWMEDSLDSVTEEDWADYMTDEDTEYTFKVRALSKSVSTIFHSDWVSSDGSYNTDDENKTVEEVVDDILEGNDIDRAPDRLAAADIKKVQVAMQSDQEILEKIESLEAEYVSSQGITTGKEVDEETGMSADDIIIVGMGLNADSSKNVVFRAQKPEEEVMVDDQAYRNTVQVDFSLDGAVPELKVPVRITIPIPEGINPEFFHVLHYYDNGTKFDDLSEGNGLLIDREEGTASFTVTRFSVFVLAEKHFNFIGTATPSNASKFDEFVDALPAEMPSEEDDYEQTMAGLGKVLECIREENVKASHISREQMLKLDGLLETIAEFEILFDAKGDELDGDDLSDTKGLYLAAYGMIEDQSREDLEDEDRLESLTLTLVDKASDSNASKKFAFETEASLLFGGKKTRDGEGKRVKEFRTPILLNMVPSDEYLDEYKSSDKVVLPGGKKQDVELDENDCLNIFTYKLGKFSVVKGTTSRPSGGGSSSSGPAVTKKASLGKWIQDEKGWWYQYNAGSWPKAQWVELEWNGVKNWYYFDENGYMETGWKQDGEYLYYLHNVSDGTQGHMYTGWHQIGGLWYYFNTQEGEYGPKGALLRGAVTPDGYAVDADGVWISG